MHYLYHYVPPRMAGTTLYPLNQMKEIHPDIYTDAIRKYKGREQLLSRKLPILDNCLWNDVIFLTAVHPARFRLEYEALFPPLLNTRCFQFEISAFDQSRLAVIEQMAINDPAEATLFDPSKYKEYAKIPNKTFTYWQRSKAEGKVPFLFLHIPHILYRGALDISQASVVWG